MRGHSRAGGAAEVARACASRRRAPQHHPDPVERPPARRRRGPAAQGDRPRHRGDRDDPGRCRAGRRDHGSGARDLRHRPQAARRRPGLARDDRRYRPDADPLGPLALHAAGAARKRLPRSRRRRAAAPLLAAGRRPQAPDREDPVRDLHRGDALLPQRHLLPHDRGRPARTMLRAVATDGHRLARVEIAAPARRRGHARRDRSAQGRRRDQKLVEDGERDRRRSSCRPPRSA